MHSIPVITTDDRIASSASMSLTGSGLDDFAICKLDKEADVISFLKFENPLAIIIDLTEQSQCLYGNSFDIIDTITQEAWLQQIGIIAICDSTTTSTKLDMISGANIISILKFEEIALKLHKIMRIFADNQRIFFQKGLGHDVMRHLSGIFYVNNDAIEASCYGDILCNLLFSSKIISYKHKQKLRLVLHELLINGIEHGNCEITCQQKTLWMESGKSIGDLIKKRCSNGLLASKKVSLEYRIDRNQVKFIITDQGSGFDWKAVTQTFSGLRGSCETSDNLSLHGRGIFIARSIVDNLTFNDKGNQVSFEVPCDEAETAYENKPFHSIGIRELSSGEVVFNQGEPSNFLYHIVYGTYEILANGKSLSVLSQDDLFLGEMSFLTSNVRSATVRALTKGKLIGISKKQFIEVLHKNPQYALLLSRVLAKRLDRLNKSVILNS